MKHDPVNPPMDDYTPVEIVASLSPNDRALRVRNLTTQAHEIVEIAKQRHSRGRVHVGTQVLLSGGDDSTTVAHIFRRRISGLVHVNTGIGIPETNQFVRDTAAVWKLPLIEVSPEDSYDALVLGQVRTKGTGEPVYSGGFPGPGAHGTMYQRLKERALDRARHELGVARAKSRYVVWIAGRRREESKRRQGIPLHEADGTVVWASAVANWTKLDLNTYRQLHDVPRNPASGLIHMSGECLCGAFAKPDELELIGMFYPHVRERIEHLEHQVRDAGFSEPHCRWGHGQGGSPKAPTGRLCTSCDAAFDDGTPTTIIRHQNEG